jgi:hypothetical protein
MTQITVQMSGTTLVELGYDDPHRPYDVVGMRQFLCNVRPRRCGKGYIYSGTTSSNDVVRYLLADMDCRLSLQGGREGIDFAGSNRVAAAVRRDFRKLLLAAKSAGLDVSEWE